MAGNLRVAASKKRRAGSNRIKLDQGLADLLHLLLGEVSFGRLFDVGHHFFGVRLLSVVSDLHAHKRAYKGQRAAADAAVGGSSNPALNSFSKRALIAAMQLQPDAFRKHHVSDGQRRWRLGLGLLQ